MESVNAELAIARQLPACCIRPWRRPAMAQASTDRTTPAGNLDARDDRSTAHEPYQRSRASRPSQGSDTLDRHRHRQLQIDGWRQDVRAVRGAPGGDDNQNIWWINRNNTDIMLLVVDQGAVVTLDTAVRRGAPGSPSRPPRCSTS